MNPIRLLLPLLALLATAAWAEEPLDPEQAYRYSVRTIDAGTVEARWDITDGYYMYRDKFRFTAEPATVRLGEPVYPAGKVKDDEFFGKVETYRGSVAIRIPVQAGAATTFTLKAVSQGCWDQGICYPPTPQQAVVDLTKIEAAIWLSLAYVLGMAVTYAAVGIAAGFSGTLLSSALQNAWVLGAFALVFVVLSLSMFGFYELQMPAALQSRLSETANRQGGSFGAIAGMGALSALIVGPCVAAPLAGALLYIAQTRDAVLGGAALFAMALGMGAPLILVGVFSRSLLPKAGPWMEAVKKFFGVIMLATALWLVTPVIPVWTQMLGWAALLIVPAIYMHALDPLPPHSNNWKRLWKGIGVLMLLAGTAMLAGVLGGARDPLQPLGFLRSEAAAGGVSPQLTFERVKSVAELDARIGEAAARGQPAMLDFYADWCVSCKEMEKFTFADPQVRARLANVRLLQADVTANGDDDKALLKRFSLFGPPGIIFFGRDGKELAGVRVVGYQPAELFLATLERALRP